MLSDRIAIRSAHVHNPDWFIRLWAPEEPTGEHWKKLIANTPVQWSKISESAEWNGSYIQRHQHRADLVRHTLLYALGGAYLDLDTITLRPFPPHYLDYDTVIGVERAGTEVWGLCNAVMLSKQFSQFQWEWLQLWQKFKGDDWNELSVRAPWLLSKVFPRLVLPVENDLLGFDYTRCYEYFSVSGHVSGPTVLHLYRTANKAHLEALTEESIMSTDNIYCNHARGHL